MKYFFVEDYNISVPNGTMQEEKIGQYLQKTQYEPLYSDIYQNLYKILRYRIKLSATPEIRQNLTEDLNTAKSLLVCKMSDKDIYISNTQLKECLLPNSIKGIVEKEIEKVYIEKGLAQRPMTFEEGTEILSAVCAFPFPERYEGNEMLLYALNLVLRRNHVSQCEFINKFKGYKPNEEIVKEFIQGYELRTEITVKQVNQKITDLEKKYKCLPTTKGARVKNLNLLYAAHYLKSVGFTTKNKDLRIAFLCLDVMGYIDENRKEVWKVGDKNNYTQWLKAVFNDANDYTSCENLPF